MKNILYTLALSVLLFSCKEKAIEKTYIPRDLVAHESFNNYSDDKDTALTIHNYSDVAQKKDEADSARFSVKFRDTIVRVQTNKSDAASATDKFSFAQFVNTQKTAMLVQIADNSGLSAPFYLLSLKDNKLDAVSLYRPSNGSQDKKFTKGVIKIGRTGYLVNNDYFITNVNAKVYEIKRQNPDERIQGDFLIESRDRRTLVFLTASSIYEVHYPTGKVLTHKLPAKIQGQATDVYEWIQNNYKWEMSKDGAAFLQPTGNDDKIVDIGSFRKG